MAEPKSVISCVASVFIRQMLFEKAGDVNHGHCHVFDHQTLLAKGSLRVEIDGVISTFIAPKIIFIKANVNHEFTALEDGTLCYCIHALRDGDNVGDIIDPSGIPNGISGGVPQNARPLVDMEE